MGYFRAEIKMLTKSTEKLLSSSDKNWRYACGTSGRLVPSVGRDYAELIVRVLAVVLN